MASFAFEDRSRQWQQLLGGSSCLVASGSSREDHPLRVRRDDARQLLRLGGLQRVLDVLTAAEADELLGRD
eukprot:1395541-Heterocapsa_arctica.AAC.1